MTRNPMEPRNYKAVLAVGCLLTIATAVLAVFNYARPDLLLGVINGLLGGTAIGLVATGWSHWHVRRMIDRDFERAEWAAQVIPGPWDTRPLPEVRQ